MKLFRSKSEQNKEPYDEFIATVKLVSGEEILTKVIVDYTDKIEKVILDNPVICQEVRSHGANVPLGYKFEPWIKMSEEDIFILDLDKIITLSEIKDDLVIKTYNNIIESGFKRQHPDLDREMGYINNIDSARKSIEKLYKSDSASKEPKKDL
tara:strand:+ start:1405 stop:1863 length:459 start_codon:yes stop_codon:yes gene_type:complete